MSPMNLLKNNRTYFDSIYASGYPALADKYDKKDMNIQAIFSGLFAAQQQQADIAMNYPNLYEPVPSTLDKVANLVYESVHPLEKPVEMVSYPSAFTTLSAKMAAAVPGSNDILKPEKMIKLLAGFVEPTFDMYANMVASDSALFRGSITSDAYRNFDFFIPELQATPFRYNEEVVHKYNKF